MNNAHTQLEWKSLQNSRISFIGGGNMTLSLIGGLLNNGIDAAQLRVADVNPQPLVAAHFPVEIHTDNREVLEHADVVVLAVKPQVLPEVSKALAAHIPHTAPLFISIAAGIQSTDLQRWLGAQVPIVRVMPNTPALVQSGASALFAGAQVSAEQKAMTETILRAVGMTVWLDDEQLMDAVTALSGSGPAYFFLIMEVMEQAALKLGLPAEQARLLTLQTAFGAAKMALESREDAATLRARVTSKGGTTEEAIKVLQEHDLQSIFDQAMTAAQQRSMALAKDLGEV